MTLKMVSELKLSRSPAVYPCGVARRPASWLPEAWTPELSLLMSLRMYRIKHSLIMSRATLHSVSESITMPSLLPLSLTLLKISVTCSMTGPTMSRSADGFVFARIKREATSSSSPGIGVSGAPQQRPRNSRTPVPVRTRRSKSFLARRLFSSRISSNTLIVHSNVFSSHSFVPGTSGCFGFAAASRSISRSKKPPFMAKSL
mmetsp:Transcript_10622/g.20575  ORF Transcript_10622/g.20575 Transcript_10622/m.20575 type:complete len:202 (+) Transcript_10622:809-1414(+)